ncbi:MAG TPA: hypothetical protein PLJ23_02980, partial [Gemmatimonadales bacterium]|nr:hypothetical protein [Gemmatimonadales bacterium]
MGWSAERWREISEQFDALLALDAEARARRLAALADDPALHAELVSLLAAADDVGARFEQPAAPMRPDHSVTTPGRRIGPYELVREIGR